jgi:DNA-binding transcriptional LysR family regulator
MAKRKTQKIERRYVGDVYGILDGVRNGLGLAILPKHLISGLKDLEIVDPQIILKVPVALYFYKQSFYSKLNDVIVNEIVSKAKKILNQNKRKRVGSRMVFL